MPPHFLAMVSHAAFTASKSFASTPDSRCWSSTGLEGCATAVPDLLLSFARKLLRKVRVRRCTGMGVVSGMEAVTKGCGAVVCSGYSSTWCSRDCLCNQQRRHFHSPREASDLGALSGALVFVFVPVFMFEFEFGLSTRCPASSLRVLARREGFTSESTSAVNKPSLCVGDDSRRW